MGYRSWDAETRTQLVIKRLQSLYVPFRSFCRVHNVPRNTMRHWLSKYCGGTLTTDERRNNGKVRTLIPPNLETILTRHFKKKPNTTIEEMRTILETRHGIQLSRNFVYLAMKRVELPPYKRISYFTLPKRKDPNEVMELIRQKQTELKNIGMENVVSIDEVPMYEEMYPTYGWGEKGKKIKCRKNRIRSKGHSIICAMTSQGDFQYKIVKRGNTKTYKQFLIHQVMKKFPSHTHLLMDNVSFHHAKSIHSYIRSKGKEAIYTVPYTPELNPIEISFSKTTRTGGRYAFQG